MNRSGKANKLEETRKTTASSVQTDNEDPISGACASQVRSYSKLTVDASVQECINTNKGHLMVVAGPSGVGKGTVVERLLKTVPGVKCSVSVTTRGMRKGEVEGEDYFFRTREEFTAMRDAGEFLESAEFAGNLYGTPKAWVCNQLDRDIDVVLEIEVQGAKQIKDKFPDAILVFLSPPTLEALKERLTGRATETPEKVEERLARAREELKERCLFHYEVVNDNLDEAVADLVHILSAERCRIRNCEALSAENEHDKNS